jgi:hypothetical protein
MQERLVSVFPVLMEYNAFTSLLQTIGSRLDALQIPWKGRSQPRSTQDANVDKMDQKPTRTFAAQSLANTNRRAKWVSMKEIQRHRSNRLCIRCGASGHMISSCQYAPARCSSPAVAATCQMKMLNVARLSCVFSFSMLYSASCTVEVSRLIRSVLGCTIVTRNTKSSHVPSDSMTAVQ